MLDILQLPLLSQSAAANLAGILPLSGLIEFIDVVTKLHSYELSGIGFLWNWPITPAGARLLLDRSEPENDISRQSACVLDGGERIPPLHCVDGRWGDNYVCSNRFTVQQCITLAPLCNKYGAKGKIYRPQYLEVVHVRHSPMGESTGRRVLDVLIHSVGLILWLGIVVVAILTPRPYALTYLATLPITGMLVRMLFGHGSRRLVRSGPSDHDRMVLVTENFNATSWTILVGDSNIVDSLLNKPFERDESRLEELQNPQVRNFLRFILRVVIAGQWAMVLAASAMQDWDAIWIAICIGLCALTSIFIHNPKTLIKRWLRSNNVEMQKTRVLFTGRRAMLSALVALNPDRSKKQWIDPILARSTDRSRWEAALDNYLGTGNLESVSESCDSAIVEGVGMARTLLTSELANRRYSSIKMMS